MGMALTPVSSTMSRTSVHSSSGTLSIRSSPLNLFLLPLYNHKGFDLGHSIFKNRDIALPTEVRLVKAAVFPVVMYGCESWTVKKTECQRIDAFELRYWRRLLRVPWTARRTNQSILKEISPGCSLEGMMLKLKLQYFGHLMPRVDSLEKTLMLGGIGGRRRREWQRMRWLDGITDSMEFGWTPGVGDGQGGPACCNSWGHKESDTTEWLNWTQLNWNEWSSGFPYFLQFKSEFGNKELMIWATVSSRFCFADFIELLHLWLQTK